MRNARIRQKITALTQTIDITSIGAYTNLKSWGLQESVDIAKTYLKKYANVENISSIIV